MDRKEFKSMEERSLKVLANDTTFINRISNTLTKLLIPTKVGLNSMMISIKRNAVLKAYENYKAVKEDSRKEESAFNRYEESYALYLESIDKYIMDSVYKKVKSGSSTNFEQNALSNYYNVVQLKEREYTEYKYRKQKFLLDLDYDSVVDGGKEKLIQKFKKLYLEKSDSLYKSILKNYSVKLADGIKEKNLNQIELYKNIFSCLDEYIKTILPLKIEEDFKDFEKIKEDYDKLDEFDIGKLDEQDFLEKNVILLGMSRILFTHSLPLVAAEQCYHKLLKDARNLVVTTKQANKQEEVYQTLLKIIQNYHEKILSTKVYWENAEERESYKKFCAEYEKAQNEEQKQIAILRRELQNITESGPKATQIRQFYKQKLVEFGAMRQFKNTCKTIEDIKCTKKQ